MRLSIREEVAYNRKVTELRETAMAEAIAEIEMENMLVEMEQYLARNTNETTTTKKEKAIESPAQEQCTRNDEVCQMLDDLERKLLIKNPLVSSVQVHETETIDGQHALSIEVISIGEDVHQEKNREEGKGQEKKTEDGIDTPKQREDECTELEHAEPEKERIVTVENISPDANGNETKLTCIEPNKSQKHRYLSIFTRRQKRKPQHVKENKSSTSSEIKTKKDRSLLTRCRNFFCCCYRPEN